MQDRPTLGVSSMEGSAAVRTVGLRRALGLGLFGAGVVTVLSLFGGTSDAHADGLLPVVDNLLGTVGAVVETVQAPVTSVTSTVNTVVETVVTEVVTPVAVVADTVVSHVPIVNTVVESTLGSTPVTNVVTAVGSTVTGTVGAVPVIIDSVTGAVLPGTPGTTPGTPTIPGNPVIPGLPGGPVVAGPAIPGLTVSAPVFFGSSADLAARSTVLTQVLDTAAAPVAVSSAPAPGPVGKAGSSLPQVAIAPTGSGGSSASGGGSAGGSTAADSTISGFTFAFLVTGRESARDDDLPPSPSAEFDTSPD